MYKMLLISMVFLCGNFCFAQKSGPISVKENFWKGTIYTQNYTEITKNEVRLHLTSNQNLGDQFNAGNTAQVWGSVFGGIGGGLIGWPLGTSIGGGDPNWNLAIYGAGATIIGALIYGGGKKKIVSAINSYNNELAARDDNNFKSHELASYRLAPRYFAIKF